MIDYNKSKTLRIVVADSGMGGLSICAEIAEGLQKKHAFEKIVITYFNAWPHQDRGYNLLPNQEERIRVFDNALTALGRYKPDLVLIACNTLSILYPKTEFSKSTMIPVIGIVDFGVRMIYERLNEHPDSEVIIMGTKTTIDHHTHRDALIRKGIAVERIQEQPCDQLATAIENGPGSRIVHQMIDGFVKEATAKVNLKSRPRFAAFCCTHYGFSQEIIQQSFKNRLGENIAVINPNKAMSRQILDTFENGSAEDPEIDINVVSRIEWNQQKVTAIAHLLEEQSTATARALMNYQFIPDLFEV